MNFLNWIPGLSWIRIAGAAALVLALAGTHWKAYHVGGANERAEHAEYVKDLAVTASKASEANRVKEKTLNLSVGRIRDALAKEKADRAADAIAAADRLSKLQSAVGDSTGPDSTTACGAHADPRDCIIAQCASALTRMDDAVKRFSSQTTGLQDYTSSVCVTPP